MEKLLKAKEKVQFEKFTHVEVKSGGFKTTLSRSKNRNTFSRFCDDFKKDL